MIASLLTFCLCQFRLADADDPSELDWNLNIPWYATATARDRVLVKSSLFAMLKTDWENAKSGVEKAEKNFETAWKLCPSDPRIPYSYGLVLRYHGQPAEAIRRFDQAQAVEGQLFPPAYQAAAWCQFEKGNFPAGLRSLNQLAERLRSPDSSTIDPDDRLDLYKWLGQMSEFANCMDADNAHQELIAVVIGNCHWKEDSAIGQRFDQGRLTVQPIFNQLTALSKRTPDDIRAELEPQLETARQALKKVSDELAEAVAELKQVKGKVKDAEINKNRKNQHLGQFARRYYELSELIPQLRNAEGSSRREMETPLKQVQKRVVDEEATRRARDDKKNGGETVYKTVYETVPKSDQERANDRQIWQTVNQSLQGSQVEFQSLNDKIAKAQKEAQQARKLAVDVPKENAAIRRELSRQLEFQSRQRQQMEQQAKQLVTWIDQPELFRAHVRTLPPYVPWSAQIEREKVQQSFAVANDKK